MLLDKKTELRKFIEAVKNIKTTTPKLRVPTAWTKGSLNTNHYENWHSLLTKMGQTLGINFAGHFRYKTKSLDDRYDQIATKYPLITAISFDTWWMDIEMTKGEIKLSDDEDNLRKVLILLCVFLSLS